MIILHDFADETKNPDNERLHSALSDFGLCPNDWTLVQKSNVLYVIQNTIEPSFHFIGYVNVERSHKKWNFIQLGGI